MTARRWAVAALSAGVAACSGSGGSPTAPAPPPVPTHSVGVALFYDENGNGTRDAAEGVGIPDAIVEVFGKQGRSVALTGEAIVEGVPAGVQMITVRPSSLPPFYEPPAPVPVVVPQTEGTIFIPVTLPIGSNRPNTYLAFGDSITGGEGSSDGDGYASRLQRKLLAHFGRAIVMKDGAGATRSNRGADRLPASLNARPAYTLIHYGTNDWNMGECKSHIPCFTIDSLRSMVRAVRGRGGLPILATIIPGNPIVLQQQPGRNMWIAIVNGYIRDMAREEHVVVADMEPAFLHTTNMEYGVLYVDHIHPNDAGYEVMAQAFFDAIVHAQASAADFGGPQLFKSPAF
jgi:lysophospholipase L1-like esterase